MFKLFFLIIIPFLATDCKKESDSAPNTANSVVHSWMTTPDKSKLLEEQPVVNFMNGSTSGSNTITVDDSKSFQGIDGFGFCLTDGSAIMINSLDAASQDALLKELFSTSGNGIGISYLRIGIGSTTLSTHDYTFDDLASGTDENLTQFSLNPAMKDLIPVLKKIIAIDPAISIVAAPWSPPIWMKNNRSFTGGTLNTSAYQALANYFVKYIQAMKAQGINITAITPQNEPTNDRADPSMAFAPENEATFIANNLGPAFKSAGLTTKIICFDHNASTPDYPETVLGNRTAYPYIDGSAFHFYSGEITALSEVHDAFPEKNIYFTEQYTSSNGTFGGYLQSATKNLIIGATRNWSRNVIEWNLAADVNNGPHTANGCPDCLPAITISPAITRNISYYLIAHASKFVRPGATRISSNITGNIQNVAFKNSDGSKVLIVLNTDTVSQPFNVAWQSKFFTYSLPKGSVATLKW